MSISRAFTLRSKRSDAIMNTMPLRAGSLRSSDKPVDIRKISGPVALLSTTNMLSYNAPNVSEIRAQRKASNSVSSTSSRSSAEDSDSSAGSHLSRDTTLTDISEPPSPEQTVSTSLFHSFSKRSPRRSASSVELRQQSDTSLATSVGSSPELPQRASSHSKKAHEKLARKRSMQHITRQNSMQSISEHSVPLQREHRNSFDFFSADLDAPRPAAPKEEAPRLELPVQSAQVLLSPMFQSPMMHSPMHHQAPRHPFGKELEQLDEVAEEFGSITRNAEQENDYTIMSQKGLVQFCADDYLREIRPLFTRIFTPHQAAAWI